MKRALLVEDNLLNRELLRTMLEGSGWAVDEADNGAEALRMLEKSLPDVVLTDLQMPVMGGLAFLKEVRKQPRLARLTIFAVSAYAMQGDRERALAATGEAAVKPLAQFTLRLVAQPAPSELHHQSTHPAIAGLGNALLGFALPAVVGRGRQPETARHLAPVAKAPPTKQLLRQHPAAGYPDPA